MSLLNRWLLAYVTVQEHPSLSSASLRPFRSALLEIEDDTTKPGAYRAQIKLRLSFEFGELDIPFGLDISLPTLGL